MPTCAAISTLRPTVTPWPICTRLSILVPVLMRVSPTAGRSTVVFAPSYIVLDDDDGNLRDFFVRAITTTHEAIAIAANDHAVLQNHAIPDGAALANGDVQMDRAIAAHRGACNSRVRIDHCAVANTRAFTNRDERSTETSAPR